MQNQLGFLNKTNVKYWTKAAKYCYSIGCWCEHCVIYDYLDATPKDCRMKPIVLELVRRYGAPSIQEESKNDDI